MCRFPVPNGIKLTRIITTQKLETGKPQDGALRLWITTLRRLMNKTQTGGLYSIVFKFPTPTNTGKPNSRNGLSPVVAVLDIAMRVAIKNVSTF